MKVQKFHFEAKKFDLREELEFDNFDTDLRDRRELMRPAGHFYENENSHFLLLKKIFINEAPV